MEWYLQDKNDIPEDLKDPGTPSGLFFRVQEFMACPMFCQTYRSFFGELFVNYLSMICRFCSPPVLMQIASWVSAQTAIYMGPQHPATETYCCWFSPGIAQLS